MPFAKLLLMSPDITYQERRFQSKTHYENNVRAHHMSKD